MNIHEERANHFQDFKSKKKSVYVVAGDKTDPAIPHFAFGKLDEERIDILAWMEKEDG